MSFPSSPKRLSVAEAVDTLCDFAELDLKASVEDREALLLHEGGGSRREQMREVFSLLLGTLKDLYARGQLQNERMQHGVQALMQLATEAAHKWERSLSGEKLTGLKEYQDLQTFYLTKVSQPIKQKADQQATWVQEWAMLGVEESSEEDLILRDVRSVRKDKVYELFFIKKTDGTPFFHRQMLHHMHLVGEFDTLLAHSDPDSFLRHLQLIKDRDLHFAAREILHTLSAPLGIFYKNAMKNKGMGVVAALNKAVMALLLASNNHNLLQNTQGKSSHQYFADFHFYMRAALTSGEYQRFLTHPPDISDHFGRSIIDFTHRLCSEFFMRLSARAEMSGYIHTLMTKMQKNTKKSQDSINLWSSIAQEDEALRTQLSHYPNGPLLKMLDVVKHGDALRGFDPLMQGNYPEKLYTIAVGDLNITTLRLPSPTTQTSIHQAYIVDEYLGFLRSTAKQGHLVLNLQDRTSWREYARASALEELGVKPEYAETLHVVTLPKDTEFYLQVGPYAKGEDAEGFFSELLSQVHSGEECGFYFPPALSSEKLEEFTKKIVPLIHSHFFDTKKKFNHKERCDFIEIFYLFFTLKLIDIYRPSILSFTCKDAIDTGACASAQLYSFLKLMNEGASWTGAEREFVFWLLHSSALGVRHRAVAPERFGRCISALEVIATEVEAKRSDLVKACIPLYENSFFKGLKFA